MPAGSVACMRRALRCAPRRSGCPARRRDLLLRRLDRRAARVDRGRSDRRGRRSRCSGAVGAFAGARARPPGASVRGAARRVRRLERDLDRVVGGARPLVELLQPRPRLSGLCRARSGRRRCRSTRAQDGCTRPRGADRRRLLVGAGREGDSRALRGLRTLCAAPLAGRLLERARAPGRARVCPLASGSRPGASTIAGCGPRRSSSCTCSGSRSCSRTRAAGCWQPSSRSSPTSLWRASASEGIAALGIAVLAALPALVWGLTQPGVADDFQSNAVRVEDGAWFGLIVFLGALAAFGVAWWAAPRRVSERTGRLVVRGALVVLVAFALFGAVVALRGGEDVVQQGPCASAQHRLEQPHEVVGRGLGRVRGAADRRSGGRELRVRAPEAPQEQDRRHRAAQPPAAVRRRDRARRARALRRCDGCRRSSGSGGAVTTLPRLLWGSPYRRTCSTVSSTTTGTSSR